MEKWSKPNHSYYVKFGYVEVIERTSNPYGSVLIISPWNYPLQLSLMPAISAIAAGNCCVIKPSEYTPATSELLEKVVNQTFSSDQLVVVTGDAQMSKRLTILPFDLIFFTGSQQTGKAVLQQVSQQLTPPVILELGGKNPCIMDETGFSTAAIQEIVWGGKFLNAGQTCIAPDSLFVHVTIYEKVLSEISKSLLAFYGAHPADSDDYARICHRSHFQKLIDFMKQGDIWYGGEYDEDTLFIAPTVITDIEQGSSIMREEIFGPLLPVIPYTDLQSLLSENEIQRDALTAYMFSTNKSNIQIYKQHMRSTCVSVNQVIHHAANPHVAFGGIGGASGHSSYHGKAGFKACSYNRTNYRAFHYLHVPDKYPPYSDKDMNVVKKFENGLYKR